MPVEIELPDGTKVRSDHLPAGVIADAAKKAETNWAHIQEAPHLGDGYAMIHLYRGACEDAGQPVPEISDIRLGELAKRFTPVGTDLPDEYDGGAPVLDPPDPGSREPASPETT